MAQELLQKPEHEKEQNLLLESMDEFIEDRNNLLKDIPQKTIRKAWFTLAHLLLDDGVHVADMGCGDGAMAFTMSVLNPNIKITAIDKSKRQINKAKEIYKRHNLTFKVGNVSDRLFEKNSLDAVINSFILHEVYSGNRYNDTVVREMLTTQFQMLKVGGTMFIRDYSQPPPEELVVIEMPDRPSTGNRLPDMSEADLLLWYSEHARPKQDPGCGGFFLEELPARFPGTRLFRLPYKWAYEFIMRKDERDKWERELPMEYTFYTIREFRKELRSMGARVQYSAPYWEEDIVKTRFEGHFRLYNDNGDPLTYPPTCFIAVAQKMSERKSLHIEERRSSQPEESALKISAMRDQKSGKIVDIVSRDMEIGEVIPYYVTEEGRLKIFLHDGIARSIANAVPRSGSNIDGKRWSSHMIEAISFDMADIADTEIFTVKNTVRFSRDFLGLKPLNNAILEKGPDYYPAPDFIDERVHTFYLNVESPGREITPKSFVGYAARFQARGKIRELDAQHVLNTISIGLIPNARLELQILSLFQKLGLRAENWTEKQIAFQKGKITAKADMRLLLQSLNESDSRFQDIKGATGSLRPVRSMFVEEGLSQGAITGLSSQDVDFVVSDEKTINTAVVLPLTADEEGDIHAGFLMEHLPVPQRHEGNGLSISAPSFNLPKEITNLEAAKKFIAEKFNVAPEMVIKLGESYFSHIGITPQRIHPFAVSVPPDIPDAPGIQFFPISWFIVLWHSLAREPHFMVTLARSYRYLHEQMQLEAKLKTKKILEQKFAAAQPDWSIPVSYRQAPQETEPETKQAPEKIKKIELPPLTPKFESEMEEFLEAVENRYHEQDEPRPNIR